MRNKRVAMVCMVLLSGELVVPTVCAENYFDPGLLKAFDGAPEIKNINKEITQEWQKGHYHLHVILNDEKTYRVMPVTLTDAEEGKLQPCFTRDDYGALGVDFTATGVHLPDEPGVKDCIPLAAAIPDATYHLDLSHMELRIMLPQFVMLSIADDYVPPSEWDEGIPAALFEYQYSGSQSFSNASSEQGGTENFLNLNSGINLGAWRLRNNSTWQTQSSGGQQWDNLSTYVERTVPRLKSEFFAGDVYTSPDTFDSISLRGIQLATDTDMLPGSLNGFAPVIHGIARSNATVMVKEHNSLIYQTNVTPGPFTINNLSPVSTGGTLDITIKESDGSETHFQQTYATVSNLQRQGFFKYSLAAGRYKADDGTGSQSDISTAPDQNSDSSAANADDQTEEIKSRHTSVAQFNSAWGLPYDLTLLDGVQITGNDYFAENIGLGADLGIFGAVSFDVTYSHANPNDVDGKVGSGDSDRLAYSRHIELTDTDIQASARRYGYGYSSLADAMVYDGHPEHKKCEYTASVNQMLMDSQSLFLSVNSTTYYDALASESWQGGWNTPVGYAQLSLSFSLSKNDEDDSESSVWDKQVAVTVSLPLNAFSDNDSGTLSTTVTSDTKGYDSVQSGYSGTALEDQQLSYSAMLGQDFDHGSSDNQRGNLDLSWAGRAGEARFGYAHESTQDKATWGANGGLILHSQGVTFGKYSTGAMALVSAPGVADMPLSGGVGLRTDQRGYALVSDVQVYNRDIVQFDARQNADMMGMDSISQTVIPTRDAVVLAKFSTHPGEKMMATLYRRNKFIPFGASVTVPGTDRAFFVGSDGQLYLNGIPRQGMMAVSYGKNQICHARYDINNSKHYQQFNIAVLHCYD